MILSVAKLNAALNPKRLVSLSIVVLRSELNTQCCGSLRSDFTIGHQALRQLKCHNGCMGMRAEFSVKRTRVEAFRCQGLLNLPDFVAGHHWQGETIDDRIRRRNNERRSLRICHAADQDTRIPAPSSQSQLNDAVRLRVSFHSPAVTIGNYDMTASVTWRHAKHGRTCGPSSFFDGDGLSETLCVPLPITR